MSRWRQRWRWRRLQWRVRLEQWRRRAATVKGDWGDLQREIERYKDGG